MPMSTRAASELLVLLTAAASANARAAAFLATGCGGCGHGYTSHDVDRRGVRTRCSTTDSDGPCPCRRWAPITTDDPLGEPHVHPQEGTHHRDHD